MLALLFFLSALFSFSTEAGEITGGTEVIPHSLPYMAYVRFYNLKSVRSSCTGFLVQRDIVITSAHCNGSKINVTLGAHNLKKEESTQETIPVLKAVRHEDYSKFLMINDIMLLKLQYKAQITPAVDIITLPTSHEWVKPGRKCSVAGWGVQANGQQSNTLKEVSLEIQDAQKCKDIFPNYNNSIQLCVGDPKDKGMPSLGDAGAPLVCDYVSQGIVNYGRLSHNPQVFTRISRYSSWIKKTIEQLEHL